MLRFVQTIEANILAVTPKELAMVASKLQPPNPDGGEFVGVLPESIQRLWAFKSRLESDLEARIDRTDPIVLGKSGMDAIEAVQAEMQLSFEEIRNLTDFFWMAVYGELDLKCTDKFSIYEGWAIYYTNPVCGNCKTRHQKGQEIPRELVQLVGMLSQFVDD